MTVRRQRSARERIREAARVFRARSCALLTGRGPDPTVAAPLNTPISVGSCLRAFVPLVLAAVAAVSAQAQPVLAGFSTHVTLDEEAAWIFLFVDGSAGPRSVLISAAGPGYAAQTTARVVADPQIEVLDASGTRIAYNDNRSDTLLADASLPSYARNAKDAALRLSLPTGAYVVRVTGVQGATGVVGLDVIDSSTRPGLASWALRARGADASGTAVRLNYSGNGSMNLGMFVSGPNLPVPNPMEDPRLTYSSFSVVRNLDGTFSATTTPFVGGTDSWNVMSAVPARFRSPLLGDGRNAGVGMLYSFAPPSPITLTVQNQTAQTNGMFLLEVHNLDNAWVRPPVVYAPARSITLAPGGTAAVNPLVGGDSSTRVALEKDGATFADISNSFFLIGSAGPSVAGTYRVRATNASGSALSSAWTITVTPGAPTFSVQPLSQTVTAGQSLTLSATVNGTGLRYQWLKNGTSIPGATNATLTIPVVTEADAGFYELLVGNAVDTAMSARAIITVLPNPNEIGRLTNLAVRAFAGAGDRILIVGFTLAGPGSKPVLIRGIGPGLAAFGLSGALADPRLGVFVGANEMASNDNWTTDDGRALGAFALTAGSGDAVVAQNLTAQNFTAQVSGIGGGVGESLVELYDGNPANSALRLVNLSTRTQLDAGQRLIVGLTISGRQPVRILVRAVGPTLTSFGLGGAHPDPTMELYSGATVIQQNDNWQNDDGRTAGAFPLIAGSKDAVVSALLAPGSYSLHALGASGTSGVVLVEVYELR